MYAPLDLRFVGMVILEWRGRAAEARIALLRHRMGEVYAVRRAPVPPSAYPVWHEYVGTVAIPSFYMKPHGQRALSGDTAAIKDRRSQEDRGQFAPLPRSLKIGDQHGLLLGHRLRLGLRLGAPVQLSGAEFWLRISP
jgi:hypothetical protein